MLDYGFYNMDCMDGMRKFPDGFFDLAIVDPPYQDVTNGGYMVNKPGGIARHLEYHTAVFSQNKPDSDYFDELFRVSKNQIIWGANYFTTLINRDSQCWVVWDKNKPEKWSFADVELAFTSFNRASRLFKFTWHGMIQEDMKHKEQKIHPTQKPVALYRWLIDKFMPENGTLLDTHVGSASSLIAARETGHKYVGFEIAPEYYAKAKQRLDEAENQMTIFDYQKEEIRKDG